MYAFVYMQQLVHVPVFFTACIEQYKFSHLFALNLFVFICDQIVGCDPNIPGQYGRTPLHYAAAFGHLHIVKYL